MNPSKGISDAPTGTRLAAQPGAAQDAQIDRTGGMYGAGIIRGVSAIKRGVALGHGFWIDRVALGQVREFGNNGAKGVKMRLAHPSLSADGTGKLVARSDNFRLSQDGEKTLLDSHITKSSKTAPTGNLGDHAMNVAEETPEFFATSVVVGRDSEAELAFSAANLDDAGNFKSPDNGNLDNIPHVRFASLMAVDFVDDPGANPDGLFSALDDGSQLPKSIEGALLYCLGVSDEKPTEPVLGVHPDRIKPFVQGVLERNDVEIFQICGETLDALKRKLNKESDANAGADSNKTEREDSKMGDLKSLTAELLQTERPDLVEKLQTAVRDECELDAKAKVKETAATALAAERERCLSIVEQAESVGVSKGIDASIKAGDTPCIAKGKFQDTVIAEFKSGVRTAENLKPIANAEPGRLESEPEKPELSANEKIAVRQKELTEGGMSVLDATKQASREINLKEEGN